ncbi:hypothetical protein KI387_008723, partial [Taxus chinensis]
LAYKSSLGDEVIDGYEVVGGDEIIYRDEVIGGDELIDRDESCMLLYTISEEDDSGAGDSDSTVCKEVEY